MASALGAVAAKLTIPNKAEHKNERNKLHGIYEELGRKIGELAGRRGELETTIQGDIKKIPTNNTLDYAIQALNAANDEVQAFNTECQTTQNEINANNQALQELLASIRATKSAEDAAKAAADAAADAAAAQTAAKEAALQKARESLQAYIELLGERLKSINDNKLDDFNNQVFTHHTNINQLSSDVYIALDSAGEAISPATREMWNDFNTDVTRFIDNKLPKKNELEREFDDNKDNIVKNLNERIKALQGVDGGANVTAKQINDALEADKNTPIADANLSEIKGRAAKLAAEFGTKATTEFATRKAEIERKIEADKASFQEKQKLIEEYQRIMSILDSQEIKEKEEAIQVNIKNAQEAENAALDIGLSRLVDKLTKNEKFGIANKNLRTSISSLEEELQIKKLNLEEKLKDLQTRSTDIKLSPPIDLAKIQAHIDALNAAEDVYKGLNPAQQARANVLRAENAAAKSRSSSPTSLSPTQPVTEKNESGRKKQQNMLKDSEDSSVPEPKRTPGRRYSIFIPTPVQIKQSTTGAKAAAARNTENTEDAIDPNVLEIFVYEDENKKTSVASVSTGAGAGAGAGAEVGGGIIQRGGEPPKVAKIIKVKKITPEIQNLFLSFKTPSEILTHDFLDSIEKNTQSIEVVDTPKDIDAEMDKMEKMENQKVEFIQSDDTTDFLSKLGQKAAHQTTIEKLMIFLDNSKNEKNESIRPTQNSKTYQDMYVRLWQFMEYTSGSIAILRSVFDNKDTKMTATLLAANQSGISQRRNDLTWISRQNNTLFERLFMEFSKCYNKDAKDDGTYSKFLEEQVLRKGAQKYRFMLNWIILIAFHWYYIQKEKSQQNGLIKCGEFIEHLYHTFIGWMEKMDSQTLNNVFTGGKTYEQHVDEYIVSDFKTDGSLKSLISGIRTYLCSYSNKGTREITRSKQQSDDKSKSSSQSQLVKRPLSATRLKSSEVLENVSKVAQGDGNDARATTTSPSPRQAWMNPVRERVGPQTPSSPPSQASPPSVPRPQSQQSSRVFRQVSPKSAPPVPPLELKSIQQEPPKIQSARTSQELSTDLQKLLPPSARKPQSDRKPLRHGIIQSQHTSNVNRNNPAIQPSGNSLPGQLGSNVRHTEGTGDLSFLSTQPGLSAQPGISPYQILTTQQQGQNIPVRPKGIKPIGSGLSVTERLRLGNKPKNKGGYKRTRKHRTPTSSTPAPATRRHRDQSSSAHKRTRRRREH